jgi:hypothetical protein
MNHLVTEERPVCSRFFQKEKYFVFSWYVAIQPLMGKELWIYHP